MASAAPDHWEICLSTLRETDRDRYLACLLSPEAKRGALAALYAFNAEIARIRDVIHQPIAGEIRLQWWRDLLEGQPSGDASGNPVATALLSTIEIYQLPKQAFLDLIEARTFDLYDDPMPDRNALEGYAGETASALLQLATMVLDRDSAGQVSEACGHGGVAQAIAGILLLLPIHSRRGQVYVPQDILAATGLDRESFLSDDQDTKRSNAITALAGLGLEHLAKAGKTKLPANQTSAFLPLTVARRVLKAANDRPEKALEGALVLPQWRRQVLMLTGLLKKRF